MAELTFTGNVKLNITPIFDSRCMFISYLSKENILGELPQVELKIKCDEDVCNILDEVTGSLVDGNGNSTNWTGYVYSVSYLNNECTIKIIAAPIKFVRDKVTTSYSSITDTIKSLAPGDFISNTESDLLNDIKIYQLNESNYKLCTRCSAAFKKNSIFGYGLGSLRILDLSNLVSKADFGAKVDFNEIDYPELTDPTLYEFNTEFIDYSEGNDPNHTFVIFNDHLICVNTEYKDLIGNFMYNKRFKTTKNIANYKYNSLTPINICDCVTIENKDTNIKNCFVTSKITSIEYTKLTTSVSIQSIDPL